MVILIDNSFVDLDFGGVRHVSRTNDDAPREKTLDKENGGRPMRRPAANSQWQPCDADRLLRVRFKMPY